MGKLFILEGGDGSGKATQTAALKQRLEADGYKVMAVTFPDYESDSSALVRMYLRGDFGTAPNDVNPYVASAFYAVDRFASFRMTWKSFYDAGGIVLADRYTTSNMVHQMVKYTNPKEREDFLTWLVDFEFNKFGLPIPHKVFLLDVPLSVTETLMAKRQHKTGGATGDIHEMDRDYLKRCHNAYDELVVRFQWERIACTKNELMRSVTDIHEEIYGKIKTLL